MERARAPQKAAVARSSDCGHDGGGQLFAQLMLALFVPMQDFAGALDHRTRQARQPGDFDAVTLIGAAFFDAAEEHDLIGRFFARRRECS